ncbi:hypothetical protein KUTeg_000834, partial [Tegillarca granosa]
IKKILYQNSPTQSQCGIRVKVFEDIKNLIQNILFHKFWKTVKTRFMAMKVFGLPTVLIIFTLCIAADSYAIRDSNGADLMSKGEALSIPEISRPKRAMPFSMNNGLRSLARMLFTQQQRRSWKAPSLASINHAKLFRLGKRSQIIDQKSTNENDRYYGIGETRNDVGGDDPIQNGYQSENEMGFDKRQRLSVNGAMATFAEMLAASGQQRLREELESNKQRLLGLGK